jgi:hypothetical protein
MTLPMAPAWLASFQAQFGAALREPMRNHGGNLTACLDAHAEFTAQVSSDAAGSGLQSAAVYTRQYWMRLFAAVQQDFPLLSGLLGSWTVNHVAQAFFLAHPPRGCDLGTVTDGFDRFVATVDARNAVEAAHQVQGNTSLAVDDELVTAAARMDVAWKSVWLAPEVPRWHINAEQAAGLRSLRLRASPTRCLMTQRWPLAQIRSKLGAAAIVMTVAPPALDELQHVLIVRVQHSVGVLPVASLHARLIELLDRETVGVALEHLQAGVPTHPSLATDVQRWLAESMELGLWSGVYT